MLEKIFPSNYKHDIENKSCYDCHHHKKAIRWWCTSEEAADHNGTSMLERNNCNYWRPARRTNELGVLENIFNFNLVFIRLKK